MDILQLSEGNYFCRDKISRGFDYAAKILEGNDWNFQKQFKISMKSINTCEITSNREICEGVTQIFDTQNMQTY